MRHIGIGAYVGRVFATQFQPRGCKACGRCPDDGSAAGDRAGEADAGDARIGHQPRGVLVREVQVLKNAFGNAGSGESLEEALGAERRLVRMLEHHGVAGNERRQHSIDGRQVGIIPGRDDGDHAQWHTLDLAFEARLLAGFDGRERCRRNSQHVARPLLETANLAGRMPNRAPHLPSDLAGNLSGLGSESVDRSREHLAAARERQRAPGRLRAPGGIERPVDARGRLERPFDVDPAIDGTHRS